VTGATGVECVSTMKREGLGNDSLVKVRVSGKEERGRTVRFYVLFLLVFGDFSIIRCLF
jgi:hypothetical protein